MGCHTWCYRKCNKKELDEIKIHELSHLICKYNKWDCAVNGKYHMIPFDELGVYVVFDERTNYPTNAEYSKYAYEMLYKYEYLETIQSINEFLDKHPDYLDIEYDSISEEEKEQLNLIAISNCGWPNFKMLQNYLQTYYDKSFDEFCVIQKNLCKYELSLFDITTSEWTEKENELVKAIEEGKIQHGLSLPGALIKIHNGNIYSDRDMPHDIFRIDEYLSEVLDNPDEIIDFVNNLKSENNKEPLTEEEISNIYKVFEKHNGNVIMDFG